RGCAPPLAILRARWQPTRGVEIGGRLRRRDRAVRPRLVVHGGGDGDGAELAVAHGDTRSISSSLIQLIWLPFLLLIRWQSRSRISSHRTSKRRSSRSIL